MLQVSKITGQVRISESAIKEIEKKVNNVSDFKEKIGKSLTKKTTEILETILAGAVKLESSDIHIEPEERQTKLRVRIDGILQDVLFLDNNIYKSIVSRIKLLAKLKLNVSDRPQDGRFSILFKKIEIEIRVSSLPSEYGESIVMRILDPDSLVDIKSLGLRKDLIKTFDKEISQPNGMIIVTGPTGSGKTTTLYAVLRKINNPKVKIITIEDPIEYHLKGISQTQVDSKKGYSFASGLRSIMRQDPDVILVGEIRDLETAQIALQAALTGHLVLTTLHTNNAAGTITRLQALGEKPANIAPAINIAIAQRLVRKICKKCSKLEKASEEEIKKIRKALGKLPKEIKIPEIKDGLKIPRAKGCKYCNQTGYKGRLGIFEFFLVDEKMEKFISKSSSTVEIQELARQGGMVLIKQDGFLKILEGLTTIEEVERVAGE